MKNKKFTIAANWKMNPITKKDAQALFSIYNRLALKYTHVNFVCAVPSVYLDILSSKKRPTNLLVCAQNIYFEDQGSYTGAISIPMLLDIGTDMVLIGHSERRSIFGVSDEIIGKKVAHALTHNMPMVVCFGENVRDVQGTYSEELDKQLRAIVSVFKTSKKLHLLHLAYEPVWAVGSQAVRAITDDELFSTLLLIRNILGKHIGVDKAKKIDLWYGGSVNPGNAKQLVGVPGIKGFLIGRAGLDKDAIKQITAQACQTSSKV